MRVTYFRSLLVVSLLAPTPLASACSTQSAASQPAPDSGWERLGTREVTFRVDRDVIHAAGEGRFRRLMFRVEGADLELFNVRVVFGNGEAFSPDTRLYFGQRSRSRVIDLPGDARVIQRIEFTYKSPRGGRDGRATVVVLGKP